MIVTIEVLVFFLVLLIVRADALRRAADPPSRPRAMTKADEARIDPGSRQWMAGIEAQLAALGFSTPCRTLVEGPIVNLFASLAEHDGNLVIVHASLPSRGISKTGISFIAGLGDGRRVVTASDERVRYFPLDPRFVGASFVNTRDLAELYDIHRFHVWEYGQEAGIARLSRGATVGEVMAYQDREADLIEAFFVKRGIYARTGSTLAVTWKGAFLAICRAMFPWRQIARRQRARQRAAILTRYRAAVAVGWTPDQNVRPAT